MTRALSFALDWQGLLWRCYEDSFRHRITARVGGYRQEGFADGTVGGLAYEQAWQLGARLELRWGVELGRARYDGAIREDWRSSSFRPRGASRPCNARQCGARPCSSSSPASRPRRISIARPARASTPIALHDVVDTIDRSDDDVAPDHEEDTISTDRLVGLLRADPRSGMHPLTLDDIDAASRGVRPLPPRAILLTIDDGYRSLYTRVYPLLLAYRMPMVAALVGEWMDTPADGMVRYGATSVPRSRFITWAEAREMQDWGLVEFASHTYSLHKGVRAQPAGWRASRHRGSRSRSRDWIRHARAVPRTNSRATWRDRARPCASTSAT